MNHFLRTITACSMLIGASGWAAGGTAQPDPLLVKQYETNPSALSGKIGECKRMRNLDAALADVACVSAQVAINHRNTKMIKSTCNSADTFVFVPPGIQGKDIDKYLREHAPKADVLQACGMTTDSWLRKQLQEKR